MGKAGTNRFDFRLVNGFDRTVSGQTVHAGITDATFPNGTDFATFITDRNGKFTLVLDTVMSTPVPATLQAGETTGNFNLDAELTELNLKASPDTLTQHKPQSVTFTITRKDGVPMSGASVVFNAHAGFVKPGGTYTTDGSGKFTVPDLTAVLSGQQSISVMVDGKISAETTFTVNTANYALSVSPDTLIENTAADVTFTVARNGQTVSGLTVEVMANADLNLSAVTKTTDNQGQIKINGLQSSITGEHEVNVVVEGQTITVTLNVTTTGYQLDTSDELEQWEPAKAVTFTLKDASNNPVTNTSVAYTISDLGGPELTGNATTDSNGTFVVNGVATTLRSPAQVRVTVNGATLFKDLDVKAASYRLRPVSLSLTQYVPQDVVFILTTDNNTPVPNVNVSFQPGDNPHFRGLPAAVDTNTDGRFTVNSLLAISSGRQTVTAIVDGEPVPADFDVTAAAAPL